MSLLVATVFMAGVAAVAFAAPKAASTSSAKSSSSFKAFAVYVENASKDNHFAPSGWMGDFGDLKLNQACTETPRSG
ncbi:MAG: hypothetical protein IKN62_06545, partial [Elusimicrobia bacterium]|nr:hypothetical protein [Elusimicrobiota bacterium]